MFVFVVLVVSVVEGIEVVLAGDGLVVLVVLFVLCVLFVGNDVFVFGLLVFGLFDLCCFYDGMVIDFFV